MDQDEYIGECGLESCSALPTGRHSSTHMSSSFPQTSLLATAASLKLSLLCPPTAEGLVTPAPGASMWEALRRRHTVASSGPHGSESCPPTPLSSFTFAKWAWRSHRFPVRPEQAGSGERPQSQMVSPWGLEALSRWSCDGCDSLYAQASAERPSFLER